MVTTASKPIPAQRKRRMPRFMIVGPVLAIVVWVAAQSGFVHPWLVLDRIPQQYIPAVIERYLPPPTTAILANAYLYQQQRPLSCEYASTAIAAHMGGWNITEYDFDTVVPLHENPHYGYRGNIWGEWGNTTDYGLYPEPLNAALDLWGLPNQVLYARGDEDVLKRELQEGRAVVVWLAMRGAINSFDVQGADGSIYQLTQYMHVMTAYGYDETGVYLTDPGTAVWQHYEWPTFMDMWNVMGGMALSVHPKPISANTDTFSILPRYYT